MTSLHCVGFTAVVVLMFGCHVQGLRFSANTSPDGFCRNLQCVADKTENANISSVYQLIIYNATQAHREAKLASISLAHTDPSIEGPKRDVINATGSVSASHAELTLHFLHGDDCVFGIFRCQLVFVHAKGFNDSVSEVVSPRTNQSHSSILLMLATIEQQLRTFESNTVSFIAQLNQTIDATFQETDEKISELQAKVYNKLLQLSPFMNIISSEAGTSKIECYRNMTSSSPRETILLWGKTWTLCDTETDGGGWVVIQRRLNRDTNFTRNWDDYKRGFGPFNSDFWIGNDVIHNLTLQGYNELRIDVISNGKPAHAQYSNFSVADENSKYTLKIDGYTGQDWDNMEYHNGMNFSTPDTDNDCAKEYQSGWWFKGCMHLDLNGVWGDTLLWRTKYEGFTDATFTEMKVRHV